MKSIHIEYIWNILDIYGIYRYIQILYKNIYIDIDINILYIDIDINIRIDYKQIYNYILQIEITRLQIEITRLQIDITRLQIDITRLYGIY